MHSPYKAYNPLLLMGKILMALALSTIVTSCASPSQGPSIVPTPNAKSVNQIPIHKQGCGPTALLNAYHFGSPQWNMALNKLHGNTDKAKFKDLVDHFGRRLSRHTHATIRWSNTTGINTPDLVDLANDFQRARKLNAPQLKLRSLFSKDKETHPQLLRRTHRIFKQSLAKGFPPIISIKRYAYNPYSDFPIWRQYYGHFVVIYQVPDFIPAQATSFTVKYIDPWGGKIKSGEIMIPKIGFFALDTTAGNAKMRRSPTLAIKFPQTPLGKKLLGKNFRTTTILSSTITPQ